MTNQSLLTRELLEGMKRADLQRVCKERGLKANLKTEAMIELLLDSSPPHFPRRPSRHRTVSMRGAGRQSSAQSRLNSTSSVIIHSDTDDDGQHTVKPESEAPSSLHPGPMTRTRKARDAQLRLGVGRPTVAGGKGARTVTRSVSDAKGARSRSGRRAQPAQDPIVEGSTEVALLPPSNQETSQSPADENGDIHRVSTMDVRTVQARVRAVVEEQIRPLQRTVASLQRQLQQQASAHAREVAALNDRVKAVMNELRELHRHTESIQLLRKSMEQLQTDLERVRQGRTSEPVHEPIKISAPIGIPPVGPSYITSARAHRQPEPIGHPRASRASPAFEYPPPPAGSPTKPPSREVPMQTSILGKRHRSTDTCDATEMLLLGTGQEETSDKELRKSAPHSSRKRAKLEQQTENAHEAPVAGPSNTVAHGQAGNDTLADQTPHTTPNGIVGDEIFTDQDFDFFDNPPNLQPDSRPYPSQAEESQHPFMFAFPGVPQLTSTPVPTGPLLDPSSSPVLSSLPFPERPHSPSPSPAPPMPHRAVVPRPPQSEAYRPFGFPVESRVPPSSSVTHGSASDSYTVLRTPPHTSPDMPSFDSDLIDGRQRASSNDVGAGLGMTSMPVRGKDTPAAPARRTMYGTELDVETRFGDFGVEGVASNFWAGGRF
ncbi:hypothetical protein B0F90DRAFT_1677253 [Multifurca ochricompacta]|uniref:SAP domain-containing protein n=1 Tax=Multifurca ochricompacta TaxID=376703 RepID=A0AAD4MCD8_9AGAM|nr:hypothetical protein B0F90DRAFT_1677253 [Multifurca ochricompacta]